MARSRPAGCRSLRIRSGVFSAERLLSAGYPLPQMEWGSLLAALTGEPLPSCSACALLVLPGPALCDRWFRPAVTGVLSTFLKLFQSADRLVPMVFNRSLQPFHGFPAPAGPGPSVLADPAAGAGADGAGGRRLRRSRRWPGRFGGRSRRLHDGLAERLAGASGSPPGGGGPVGRDLAGRRRLRRPAS
ncbi:MAG: hypothetical protein MZV70_08595 [Desulfobacterales bacterium]|nr:hypothetical protein [Desulfobacterales bacterium]